MSEVTTIETLSSAASQTKLSSAKESSYSLAGRMLAGVIASHLFLAVGIFLSIGLYGKTQSPILGGLAGFLVLLVAILIARWSLSRGLQPVRQLSEQMWEVSAQNLKLPKGEVTEQPEELTPLVQAVETLLERIKTSVRQRRDFTTDSAHELKTSVAIIKSSLQSLRHRPRSQREYEFGLDGLLEDCSRLEDLLEKMLRLAKIEQASETAAQRKMGLSDLKSTCQAALSRVAALAEERNVALEFEAVDSLSLPADAEDLELIWTNLLENAIRFSPPGTIVKMRLQSAGTSNAEVSILDSGPGIPTVELPYIFERFHRGDPSPTRAPGGFGLGLAICKALTESYAGTIEAMNLPEQGAELRVRLPLGKP